MNEIFIQSSSDCLWAIDANYKHTYVNRKAEQIFGYTDAELRAMDDPSVILHADDRGRTFALFERVAKTGLGWQNEILRIVGKDGAIHWVESSGNAIFDDQGRLVGFAGADRDITDRIEQEERIAEVERRYRATFEHAGVGIGHVDLETGAWIHVNQPLCDILGYSREELYGYTFQELTHPEELPNDQQHLDRLLSEEISSYTIEKRYRRKDGSFVWTSLTASIARGASHLPEYGIAVIKDISERKAALEALLQSERDARRIFDSSHDPMMVMDPETGIIFDVNDRATRVYGYARKELIGMSIHHLSVDSRRGGVRIPELFAGAPEVHFVTAHRDRSGREIELEITATFVQHRGGRALLTTNRDVTERNRLARALAASERRFRAIIEHGYDVMTVIDERGVVRFASGTVRQELGYSPEELTGTMITDRIHEADRERVRELFARVMATPDARDTLSCRVLNKHGQWRTCEGTLVNMMQVDGVGGMVVTVRDITERVLLESQLEQTRRVESLGRVAATVAHEFNNALMALKPAADALQHKYGDHPELARIAQQLAAGLQRGRRVAGGILRFSNPSEPVRNRVELESWLRGLASELRPVLGSRFELALQIAGAPAIVADPEQLYQLLMNLVLNARDAMPAGGTITLIARRDGASVDLAVRDTGPGVPMEIRPRLYEPLFTTKRNGTGLGLSVCEQIVSAHGGALSVEDAPGSGALFRARFAAAPDVDSGKPRVLLVEDDPVIADALLFALEDRYEVTWSDHGDEVVERVRELRPQLVLLDVQLPNADGREIYASLRRHSIDVPVVLMSGSESVSTSQLDGGAAFLPKPFDLELLFETVERIAGRAA
jgi:two-component system, cell cycle sensor histidine kinase and response regulator CckA